ncbi:C2 domain-containing protein [Kalaharituber pfeilii]|nr:C2 domain-containing protein [Kalaharituber pfeilii]
MEVENTPPPPTVAEEQELDRQKMEAIKQEAYEFDPNAPPEEKAAQLKKAAPPGLVLNAPKLSKPEASGIITDVDIPATNGTKSNLHSPTVNGSGMKSPTLPATPFVNGFPKAGEDDWSRTSGPPRLGSWTDEINLAELKSPDHQTWVAANLSDNFYGDWWHNAGVIVFACILTWFITLIRGGLAWIILVMATCATYYRTSIMRVRRNIRDDLTREFAKQRLASDVESLEWINSFLVKFWPIYSSVLEASITNTVDGILAVNTPGFLDSIRLTTFQLGSKPPRLDFVKTYPKTEIDIVEMDWKFSFTPNDTSDLTSKQIRDKINPKIVLEVRIGQGVLSKGIPIILENMSFSGHMKFKIKLQVPYPHIEKVDVCFLERPSFDFVLKPIGGDTFGFDIGFLPGLTGFIQEQVHANLGPMFYAPNLFTVEVAKMLGGAPIDQAVGVVQVTIHNAQGLKNSDKFSGSPDPYVVCSIDNGKELARTKTILESENPRWNETKHIIITTYNGNLTLNVFDFNDFRKDKELGSASFDMKQLEENPEHENVSLPIMVGTKQKGQIVCDIKFFPVLEEVKLDNGTVQPPPDLPTGILRYTVSQAKDLDASKSIIGQLSPYAVMLLNNRELHTTAIRKRNNSPIWEEFHEVLVTNKSKCTLGLKIMDDKGLAADPLLGNFDMKLNDLLKEMEKGNEWFNLAHAKTGKVKVRATWKPVAIKGALGGSGGYVTPIGVMRIHFQSAKELRNLEAVGKSDPYGRVLLNGIEKARTVVFTNELNPKWDEVLYVPVHNSKETITLEVMDAETMGSDRSLGAYSFPIATYVREDENGLYMEHSEKVPRSEGLILSKKGSAKGFLNFTVAFYPCLNVADPEEEDEEKKEKEQEEADAATSAVQPATSTDEVPTSAKMEKQNSTVSNGRTSDSESTKEKSVPRIRLTPEELLKYNCGLLIFKIIEGHIAKTDTHLEVLMDDMLYPSYSTAKIKTKDKKFDEIGDAVVRELDFSKITIRLRESSKDKEHGEDDIVAKLTGQTQETLRQCLNNPTMLTLKHNNGDVSKIKISLKYIPIKMSLDPSESINNMGTLRVDVFDASNLKSADRNGKSDPFCIFELNDEKVFKSKVLKKTLHPAWNEFFDVKIPSRTAANFIVKVYDWDLAGDSDFLGQARINLATLEPFTVHTATFKLTGKKGEEGNFGEIRLRLLFKSDYVIRSRQGSSTFSGTFAAPGKLVTGVAGAPLKVGGIAVSGIKGGASFIKRGIVGKPKSSAEALEEEQVMEETVAKGGGLKATSSGELQTVDSHNNPQISLNTLAEENLEQYPTTPNRNSLAPDRNHRRRKSATSIKSTSPSRPDTSGSGADLGVATICLHSASGFAARDLNMRGRVRVLGSKTKEILKSKSHKTTTGEVTWDETCSISCTADQQFQIYIEDDHLFNDKPLGEAMFAVDDTGTGKDTVIRVGTGQVVLKTSFKPSGSSANGGGSPKRRGFLGKSKA